MSDDTTDFDYLPRKVPPKHYGLAPDDRPLVFCVNCKHRELQGGSWCISDWACHASPTEPRYDYVTGKRLNFEYKWCSTVNIDGHCPKYEAKE